MCTLEIRNLSIGDKRIKGYKMRISHNRFHRVQLEYTTHNPSFVIRNIQGSFGY